MAKEVSVSRNMIPENQNYRELFSLETQITAVRAAIQKRQNNILDSVVTSSSDDEADSVDEGMGDAASEFRNTSINFSEADAKSTPSTEVEERFDVDVDFDELPQAKLNSTASDSCWASESHTAVSFSANTAQEASLSLASTVSTSSASNQMSAKFDGPSAASSKYSLDSEASVYLSCSSQLPQDPSLAASEDDED